jgi:hypothetical protein
MPTSLVHFGFLTLLLYSISQLGEVHLNHLTPNPFPTLAKRHEVREGE